MAPKRKQAFPPGAPAREVLPFQQFFGALLRRRGWSLREAGAQVGIAGPNAWAYVQGLSTPNEQVQERIARLAGVPVEEVARLVWQQKRRRRETLARARGVRTGSRGDGGPILATPDGPWARLEALIGTVEGPRDWAEEHDHYLYGLPRRRRVRR